MRYFEDPILGKGRAADVSGGTGSADYVGGTRIAIAGETISFVNSATIQNVTGNSVTLEPDTAYKITATASAVTLNANVPAAGSWAYEGHAEIFVAGTGYIVTGANVVLANPLEPDAVNNCVLRFHDGTCIIDVEDHVYGYIVTSISGTTQGTLPYGITSATSNYIAFDATTNGSTIDLSGSTASGEKHLVGNGYTETTLTGAVDCSTNKVTVANLGLQNVQIVGGTMTLGDAWIPQGGTVTVLSGRIGIEKVTGNGGTLDLNKKSNIGVGATVNVTGVTVCNGYTSQYTAGGGFTVYGRLAVTSSVISGCSQTQGGGGAILLTNNGNAELTSCVLTGNTCRSNMPGGAIWVNGTSAAQLTMTGCHITSNNCIVGAVAVVNGGVTLVDCDFEANTKNDTSFETGEALYLTSSASALISGCSFGANQGILLRRGNTSLTMAGSNVIHSVGNAGTGDTGTVLISSGAILDLTGNTNATPIAPGGGIVVGENVQIYPSAGSASAVEITGGTFGSISNDGVLNIGTMSVLGNGGAIISDGTAVISGRIAAPAQKTIEITGVTVTRSGSPVATDFGGSLAIYSSCTLIDTRSEYKRSVSLNVGSVKLVDCTAEVIYCDTTGYTLTLAGDCSITKVIANTGDTTSAIISSGASINLTSSINPGGGITVLTGGCTVNGNAIPAGTYTSIDSNGQPT